jgi:hypothetical protein
VARGFIPAGARSGPTAFGAASQPSGDKSPRHRDDENLALNFHQRRVALSVSDKFYLCAKITFNGFEDSSLK